MHVKELLVGFVVCHVSRVHFKRPPQHSCRSILKLMLSQFLSSLQAVYLNCVPEGAMTPPDVERDVGQVKGAPYDSLARSLSHSVSNLVTVTAGSL